ncbi:MAG: DUF4129 domain-containing protein [Pricia sp.]
MPKFLFICFTVLLLGLKVDTQLNATNGPTENDSLETGQADDSLGAENDSAAVTYQAAPLNLRKIDEADTRKYQDDPAFHYEVAEAEPTWWDDFMTWVGNLWRRFLEGIFGAEEVPSLLEDFSRILPYLLLGILLYLLIRFFLSVNASGLGRSKNELGTVGLSEEEHLIKNEDLQQLVQKALADKNYRLAIRYYYLHLLQLMTEKDIISWELQKTNDDYLREIDNPDLKPSFSKITRWYDYIWYGEFPIDESRYYRAEKAFASLKNTLNGHG